MFEQFINDELKIMRKEAFMVCFKAIFHHLSGVTEENYKIKYYVRTRLGAETWLGLGIKT
jgi:hypothetical protein